MGRTIFGVLTLLGSLAFVIVVYANFFAHQENVLWMRETIVQHATINNVRVTGVVKQIFPIHGNDRYALQPDDKESYYIRLNFLRTDRFPENDGLGLVALDKGEPLHDELMRDIACIETCMATTVGPLAALGPSPYMVSVPVGTDGDTQPMWVSSDPMNCRNLGGHYDGVLGVLAVAEANCASRPFYLDIPGVDTCEDPRKTKSLRRDGRVPASSESTACWLRYEGGEGYRWRLTEVTPGGEPQSTSGIAGVSDSHVKDVHTPPGSTWWLNSDSGTTGAVVVRMLDGMTTFVPLNNQINGNTITM